MANYPEVLDNNARMMKNKGKKPALDHLRIYKSDNEGPPVVEHHFEQWGSADPEVHSFKDGISALKHVAKHMGIKAVFSDGAQKQGDRPGEEESREEL